MLHISRLVTGVANQLALRSPFQVKYLNLLDLAKAFLPGPLIGSVVDVLQAQVLEQKHKFTLFLEKVDDLAMILTHFTFLFVIVNGHRVFTLGQQFDVAYFSLP